MRVIFKRLIAIAMVGIIAASLSACGNQEPVSSSGGGATGSASGEVFDTDALIKSMPTELKGTTIDFLNWYNPDDRAHEKAVIKAFEAATGITVNVITAEYGPNYSEKLAGLVATGDAPDTFRMKEPGSVWMKTLQPISNTGYDFSDSAWNDDVKEYYSVNGIQYAANLSYTPFTLFQTLSYHPSTIEEYGFEDPWELYKKGEWTWDKLEEMCQEWVKQGPKYYGVTTSYHGMIPSSAGKDFVSYDGKQWNMNLYDSELLDLWKRTLEGRESRIYTGGNTVFDGVKYTSLFNYYDSTSLEASSTYCARIKRYGDWSCVPMPKVEGKDYYVAVTELIGFGVPIGADNIKAVPYFISWYANLAKYDMDTMFYNEHAKEVYEALASEPNRMITMSSNIFDFGANPFVWSLFHNAESAQITTFIQQEEYKCRDKLTQHNQVLSNMNNEIK